MAEKTALYQRHVELGASMTEFAGWLMPLQYSSGPQEEHRAVRNAVGLFDIGHMGQFEIRGDDAPSFLQRMLTSDAEDLDVGQARYGLLCYADGGTVDDILLYRLPASYLMVVNAGNRKKDYRWLDYHRGDADVAIEDISPALSMLALQGPRAQELLQPLCDQDLDDLAFYHVMAARICDVDLLVSRTGYTGEDGFELYLAIQETGRVWDCLRRAGETVDLLPCGLAARDSLRFEAGMALYGHELAADVTPLQAGLRWTVAFDTGDFVGREALLKERLEGVSRRLVGLEMVERGVPRQGYAVTLDGETIGRVTSGMYAPTLDAFLALAYVPPEHAALDTELGVMIHDRERTARVVKTPFYKAER